MKKHLQKILSRLEIATHYLRLFFKYFGVVYLLIFCYAVYTEDHSHPHYRTTPYIYITKGITIEQMAETLRINKHKYGISNISMPYKPDLSEFPIRYKKCRWHSAVRSEFDIKISDNTIHYSIVDCGDSLELFPIEVRSNGKDASPKYLPELNEDLQILLYHKSTMAHGEEILQSILPNMKKIWNFPFQTDLWYLLFVVRPNRLSFLLHFMLIGNFIIMYILKRLENFIRTSITE